MKFTILDQYNSFVENHFIKKDIKQIKVLEIIDQIWLNKNKLFYKGKYKKGIYLYGGVGTGKTFLLNLFYQFSKVGEKIHFNHLMNNIHKNISSVNKNEKKLESYVKEISKKNKILFIDELHIFNIVDALIVKKIFMLFDKYNIFILVSSNFHPKELYLNGLQRGDFLPFIDLILSKFEMIKLDNSIDYRRITLNQSKTYFSPIHKDTQKEFKKLFERFVDKSMLNSKNIRINNRLIKLKNYSANVALTNFDSLCSENLGHGDYKNLAKKFSLLFIENIPQFDHDLVDECRRFIILIDMLYEQKCSVVLLAEEPIVSMCKIKGLSKEFKRTASRLYEMTLIKPN